MSENKKDKAEKHQTWWQKHKQALIIATVVVVAIIVLLIAFALAVHWFGWDWTGFTRGESKLTKTPQGTTTEFSPGKRLWDWMQLLLIPIILVLGGFWLNQIQKQREERTTEQRAQTEREIAEDNQHENALQIYIDKMSELLLEKKLRKSEPNDEVREIARVRTLTILTRLDDERIMNVLQFLLKSSLIDKEEPIIDLEGADLNNAVLNEVKLNKANLSGTNLNSALLIAAQLSQTELRNIIGESANFLGADLSDANLSGANLYSAILNATNLSGADLHGANLSQANLGRILSKEKVDEEEQLVLFRKVYWRPPSGIELVSVGTGHDYLHGRTDIEFVFLTGSNLAGANLSRANLSGANLKNTNLSRADLTEARLYKADFSDTNLTNANLKGAINITVEELEKQTKLLQGAIMPDGSVHP